jgi:hypothetical protein
METNNPVTINAAADRKALSPEMLRQFPGFQGLDDTETATIISQLTEFSRLLYQINAVPENINH